MDDKLKWHIKKNKLRLLLGNKIQNNIIVIVGSSILNFRELICAGKIKF